MVNPASSPTAGGAAGLLESGAPPSPAIADAAAARVRRGATAALAPATALAVEAGAFGGAARALTAPHGRAPGVEVPGWAKTSAPLDETPDGDAAARSPSSTGGARPSSAKASSSASASSAPSSKSALAFLSDPRLSVEEKLIRLLSYLNARWEKEMEAKLKELAGQPARTASASPASGTKGATKKRGGLLSAVGAAASKAFGGTAIGAIFDALKIPGVKSAVGKIGGAVLAAAASALGCPAAAPLLLRFGPALVDGVAGAVGSAGGAAPAATGSSAGASTASAGASGAKPPSDAERQGIMLELQRLQEKQKEMFALVSNFVRSTHETRMGAINNLR